MNPRMSRRDAGLRDALSLLERGSQPSSPKILDGLLVEGLVAWSKTRLVLTKAGRAELERLRS